jgi:branched-chain amino acid aminotransferase
MAVANAAQHLYRPGGSRAHLSLAVAQGRQFSNLPDPKKQTVGGAGLEWDKLFFQYLDVYSHSQYTWKDGAWDNGKDVAEKYMQMHVMANVLHYGQALFEGAKAFHCKDGKVRVFNDRANYQRMMLGCRRLGIPEMTEEMFLGAIDRTVRANLDFVPPYGSNGAMYLRPNIFGSGHQLGLGSANEFTFNVVVAPVGSYYKTSKLTAIPCCVMEEFDRAAPMGVGHVKAAGNYAADIHPSLEAKNKGFPIGLYLDAQEHKYVEEFNTSNFVGITADQKYVTPNSPSVLGSITNLCLEALAKDMGYVVERRPIDFDKEAGTFTEVGAVGTAVVVTPIKSIARGDKVFEYDEPNVLQKLHDQVRAIQVGEAEDTHGWMRTVA